MHLFGNVYWHILTSHRTSNRINACMYQLDQLSTFYVIDIIEGEGLYRSFIYIKECGGFGAKPLKTQKIGL